MRSSVSHSTPNRPQHEAFSKGGAIGTSPESRRVQAASRFDLSSTPASSTSSSRDSSPLMKRSPASIGSYSAQSQSPSSSPLGSSSTLMSRFRLDSAETTQSTSMAEKTTRGSTTNKTRSSHLKYLQMVLVLLICAQLFQFQWDLMWFLDFMKGDTRNDNAFGILPPPTNKSSTSTFTFPDVDFRTKYYMGSWYDRNLSAADVDCNVFRYIDKKFASTMHDRDILYTHNALENQIQSNNHWNVELYLKFYLNILKRSKVPSSSIVAMCVGDSSSSNRLPVAAKTRQAGFVEALEKSPGDSTKKGGTPYFPIIWPVNMVRHFGPVAEYLQFVNASNVTKWEDKKEAIIWRGGFTGVPALTGRRGFRPPSNIHGSRVQAVMANCYQNVSKIDVAFHDIPKRNGLTNALAQELKDHCVRIEHSTMQEQLEYKYILSVEGNDVSSGLKWQLASNSVVFMAKPRTVSFAMEDQLVPFYHYIPVNDNYTNLEEMVEWAIAHDDEAKRIAEQSTQYMNDLWISDKAQEEYEQLQTNLALHYQQQFASSLWSCLPEEERKEVNLSR